MILTTILEKHHIDAGLQVMEIDDDFVYLFDDTHLIAIFSQAGATRESIAKAADEYLSSKKVQK